ncbi:MAG: hypothetical protein JNK12_07895 [Acidimicrobiales bacterium]|nr:hypothetical protein [Acidimicrobiales bacterium]
MTAPGSAATASPTTTHTAATEGRTGPFVLVAAEDGLHHGGRPAEHLAGRAVTAVTATDPAAAWALVDGAEVVRVTPDGAEEVARLTDGRGLCIHEDRGTVFVGGTEARLWRLEGSDLVRVASFDDAPTRSEWSTPWGGPPDIFSMASHGDDLYVSVHVGGILHSDDDGRNWRATIDLHDDVHQVVVDDDGTMWAATGRRGLARSTDKGRTWQYLDAGLHATYLLAVAVTDAGVLVSAQSGHAGRDTAVYLLDGDRFEPVAGLPEPLSGVSPRHLAASGTHAALATDDGGVHLSHDGGRTWRSLGAVDVPHGVIVTGSALP